MRFYSIFSDDDAKFVDATLDEAKRQERIERLSRSRRLIHIGLIFEMGCIVHTTLADVMSRFSHQANAATSSSTMLWFLFVFIFAMYIYTDLQVKFLKAGVASKANASG